mmetsp:Transcript_1629/g.2464  ORF Transcript_1629/g.2464 Transcript_1629/m.2464 type:complete len:230 (+) Transcript_1629:162-851(+)
MRHQKRHSARNSSRLSAVALLTVGILFILAYQIYEVNYDLSCAFPFLSLQSKKDQPRIVGFYHISQVAHWRQIVESQVRLLELSGVTREKSACVDDWRKVLEYFVIERWSDCYEALATDVGDTCGPLFFHNFRAQRFYAGNYWWSTCKHINTLPEYDRSFYTYAEQWIGLSPMRMINCYQMCVDPYKTEYPAYLYRGETCTMPYNIITENEYCDANGYQLLKGLAILVD